MTGVLSIELFSQRLGFCPPSSNMTGVLSICLFFIDWGFVPLGFCHPFLYMPICIVSGWTVIGGGLLTYVSLSSFITLIMCQRHIMPKFEYKSLLAKHTFMTLLSIYGDKYRMCLLLWFLMLNLRFHFAEWRNMQVSVFWRYYGLS